MALSDWVLFAIILLSSTLTGVSGQCVGSPMALVTTSSKKFYGFPSSGNYSNNVDCTWEITTTGSYPSSSYYMEITWSRFDVVGKMPSCSTDYLEIFVGSPYRSLGRFCSSNIFDALPFNIYSYNARVKFVLHSDGQTTGFGFRIGYEMRYRSSQYLGYSATTSCRNTWNLRQSGNIYSTRFPNRYYASVSDCKHIVTQPKGNRLKIVFMDFDLRNPGVYCTSYDDYVRIYGSSTSTIYGTSISSYLCGFKNPFSYTSSYKNTWLMFHRNFGGSTIYNDRGYVVGYIAYDVPETPLKGKSSAWKIITGVVVSLVVLGIIGAVIMVWLKMKSKGPVANAPVVVQHPPPEPPKRKSSKSSSSSSSSDSDSDENKKKKKKHKHDANANPGYPGYNAYPPPPQQAIYPPQSQGYPTYNLPNQPPVYQ